MATSTAKQKAAAKKAAANFAKIPDGALAGGGVKAGNNFYSYMNQPPLVLKAEQDAPNTQNSGESSSSNTSVQPEVKVATPDLVQVVEDGTPPEVIADLLFEDIGGTEILSLSRHDMINGIDIKYQQISNLAKVESTFGGDSLINLQNSIEQIFKTFPIKRYQYLPENSNDPSGLNNQAYLDASGNLNIEFINIVDGMQIEVEFKTIDINDIIY